ncbi:MAG: DciA family protein [Silanimonas sp.]
MLRSRNRNSTESASAAPSVPRPAGQWVAEGDLAALVARAQWLDAADQRFRRHLPPALAGQVRLANVDRGTMVVVVPSPAWKARLRMDTALLLAAADAAGIEARSVTLKVVPPDAPLPDRPGAPLSAKARATLEAAAQSVADPDLKAQLLRLAASGRAPGLADGKTESTDGSLKNR